MDTLNTRITGGLVFMLLASGTALAAGHKLLFANAQNTAALTTADQQAIYGQLGLKEGPDGKTLVFDGAECPPLHSGSGDVSVQAEDRS